MLADDMSRSGERCFQTLRKPYQYLCETFRIILGLKKSKKYACGLSAPIYRTVILQLKIPDRVLLVEAIRKRFSKIYADEAVYASLSLPIVFT